MTSYHKVGLRTMLRHLSLIKVSQYKEEFFHIYKSYEKDTKIVI